MKGFAINTRFRYISKVSNFFEWACKLHHTVADILLIYVYANILSQNLNFRQLCFTQQMHIGDLLKVTLKEIKDFCKNEVFTCRPPPAPLQLTEARDSVQHSQCVPPPQSRVRLTNQRACQTARVTWCNFKALLFHWHKSSRSVAWSEDQSNEWSRVWFAYLTYYTDIRSPLTLYCKV